MCLNIICEKYINFEIVFVSGFVCLTNLGPKLTKNIKCNKSK